MTILFIFFALPLATIIISIALQKILKNPCLVAAIIFSIFLIVTFAIGVIEFIIAAIIYAIISYITAVITCIVNRFIRRNTDNDDCRCRNRCYDTRTNNLLTISSSCNNNNNNRNGDLLTISSNGCNGVTNDLLTISSNCNRNNDNDCNCNNCNWSCNCNQAEPTTINGVLRIRNDDTPSCCNYNNRTNNNNISTRINVIPNNSDNGRTGCICGRYRRN